MTRVPSLAPEEDFQMPDYTRESPAYTQMTSLHGRSALKIGWAFKADKMKFWNHEVPALYLDQLRQEIRLLEARPSHPALSRRGGDHDVLSRGGGPSLPPPSSTPYISGHWALVTACVGLFSLTLLLSVCYCQVRRQLNTLLRQSSLSGGQTIL